VDPPDELTRLLEAARSDPAAFELLFARVYDELRQLAAGHLRRERADHTLQATALVNEAWLRLAGDARHGFESRRHFFGAAARAMQRVLTDHARRVLARKRGAGGARLTLTGLDLAASEDPARALELSEALERLEREDPRAAEVARLRLYAGLEMADVASALGTSERTVAREWAYARARLTQLLA
jgi:RNA polymerase sigma factor (TIGR02999 family)